MTRAPRTNSARRDGNPSRDARLDAVLGAAHQALASSPSARADAEVLLSHVLGKPRHYPLTWPDEVLEEPQLSRFRRLVERRADGEPVAYLIGTREFWSLPLEVTPDTLIPRPETECLVERVLELIPEDAQWEIADLGTGTGAIAIALARERPRCRVTATEVSPPALAVAKRNAERLAPGSIAFREGHWLKALGGVRYQLLVSNPPYVADSDPHLRQGDLRFEPRLALAAGSDGLGALRELLAGVTDHLACGGFLALEHGFDQARRVRGVLRDNGMSRPRTYRDHAGRDRVTTAVRD